MSVNVVKDGKIVRVAGGVTEIDNTPTAGSHVPISSDGVFRALGLNLVGTLNAGETELVLTNSGISESSTIDIYTNVYGISPENVVVENGKITLMFSKRDSDLKVKVKVI